MSRFIPARRIRGRGEPTPGRSRRRTVLAALLAVVLSAGAAVPAEAIVGGTRADSTPTTRATVFLGGCTGTLVATDLVLTAGHCVTRPGAGSHVPFRPPAIWDDWERPDRFYPLVDDPSTREYEGPRRISVGTRTAPPRFGTRTASPRFETNAIEYALPGVADMLLLRLDRRVPPRMAVPARILTRLPREVTDPSAWLRTQSFLATGFGDENDANNVDRERDGNIDNWMPSVALNEARHHRGVFPCTDFDAHKLCVEPAEGSGVRTIDSGSPLYWTAPSGQRFVVGVLQRYSPGIRAAYTATFFRGGSSVRPAGLPLSNLGGWLEQTVAGRRGATAFLRTFNPLGDHYVDRSFASNPAGLRAHVRRRGTGRYEAVLEGLRHDPCVLAAGVCTGGGVLHAPRVALVTALGTGAVYCKLGDAAAADRIRVRCYGPAGRPADARFSLLTGVGDAGLMIRVPGLTSGATTVPSDHGPVAVTRTAPGRYEVAAAEGRPAWRNVLVNAKGADSRRCHVDSWTARSAIVRCMRAGGTPTDSGFTLAATATRDSSYVRSATPTATLEDPEPAHAQTAGTSTRPYIRRIARGRYRLTFSGLPMNPGGNVQATAFGRTTHHCKTEGWSPASASIACFTAGGAPADTRFVARYFDPLDTGRHVEVTLHALRSIRSDDACAPSWRGTLKLSGGAEANAPFAAEAAPSGTPGAPVARVDVRTARGARYVVAELSARDENASWACGGFDDVDLATAAGTTTARIRIDLQEHTVEVLDGSLRVLGGLGTWWVDGRDGPERGRAELSVAID